MDYVINVYKVTGKKKDGKEFTAFETTDTVDKIRTTVVFVQDGKQAPKENCKIKILDGWLDKRKRYPIIRVKDYEVISTNAERKDTLKGFIATADETDEKSPFDD